MYLGCRYSLSNIQNVNTIIKIQYKSNLIKNNNKERYFFIKGAWHLVSNTFISMTFNNWKLNFAGYDNTQLSGIKSPLQWWLYHLSGVQTIFWGFEFRYAPHQLNVLLAVTWCLHLLINNKSTSGHSIDNGSM